MEPISLVVPNRTDAIDKVTTAVTPKADEPNIVLQPMNQLAIIAVRASRVYVQSVLGVMTMGGLGVDAGLLPNDMLALFLSAAQLALGPAVFSILTNATELLARIDESFPKFRA
jgi:hypothetical protein